MVSLHFPHFRVVFKRRFLRVSFDCTFSLRLNCNSQCFHSSFISIFHRIEKNIFLILLAKFFVRNRTETYRYGFAHFNIWHNGILGTCYQLMHKRRSRWWRNEELRWWSRTATIITIYIGVQHIPHKMC